VPHRDKPARVPWPLCEYRFASIMLVCASVTAPGPRITPSTEKDVGEVECGAAGDRAQSAIRASVQRHARSAAPSVVVDSWSNLARGRSRRGRYCSPPSQSPNQVGGEAHAKKLR